MGESQVSVTSQSAGIVQDLLYVLNKAFKHYEGKTTT